MLEAIKEFWKALEPKVNRAIAERTRNCVRRERYDVTAPPDGSKIGVKPPYGVEIFLPYAPAVANAQVGQTVIVEWRGSLSTGIAVSYGDGLIKGATIPIVISTAWNGSGPYTQNISVPGMNADYAPIPYLVMPNSGQSAAMAAFKSIVAISPGENAVTVFSDSPTTTNINVLLKL